MQKMQTCMQGVDQSQLQAFEQQASQIEAEVKSLCASGKRDAAQQQAVVFAQEVTGNPDIRKMMECGKMMNNIMPRMPFMDQADETDKSAGHVCDQ